jgi:hypothetical protein
MQNRLRGSKLDAKKRAEYQTDVTRVEDWDTSVWPTWTVTGRLLPERCDVAVAPTVSHAIGAGGRYYLRLQVIRSHISVVCAVEKGDPSVFQIADAVRSALAFPIDYIAFQNRGPTRSCWTFASTIKPARSRSSLFLNRHLRPKIPVSVSMRTPTNRTWQCLGWPLPYPNSQRPCTI